MAKSDIQKRAEQEFLEWDAFSFEEKFRDQLLDSDINYTINGVPQGEVDTWLEEMREHFYEMEDGKISVPEAIRRMQKCINDFEHKHPNIAGVSFNLTFLFVGMMARLQKQEKNVQKADNISRFAASDQMREKCVSLLNQSDRYEKDLSPYHLQMSKLLAKHLEDPEKNPEEVFINVLSLQKQIDKQTKQLPKDSGVRKWLAKFTKRFS